MSSVSQLPKQDDVYDIFRIMLTLAKILEDGGYALEEKYEYLTKKTLLESEAIEIIKRSKFPPLHFNRINEFDTSESSEESDEKKDEELEFTEALKYLKFRKGYKDDPDTEWDLMETFYLKEVVEEHDVKSILKKKYTGMRILPRILESNLDTSKIPIIFETNPLAINMNARENDIIEITLEKESLNDKGKHAYIKVILAPEPYAINVVVCNPDNVLKIVEEEMAAKSKKMVKKKAKLIMNWMFITRTPTETDRIVIPQGFEAKFLYYQHLYIDPFEYMKSPAKLRKLSYRESFDLKTLPSMKSLKFTSISVEDPISVRLGAKRGDIIKLHNNNIFSEQSTSGINYREVK